jgi:hypothetical protein
MDKWSLSERDICTKFITPALRNSGWDEMLQIREEFSFTKGRIIVRGKLVSRGQAKRADYILYFKPNIPLALIEAKDNSHSVGDGMQQGLEYAATLNIPFRSPLEQMLRRGQIGPREYRAGVAFRQLHEAAHRGDMPALSLDRVRLDRHCRGRQHEPADDQLAALA